MIKFLHCADLHLDSPMSNAEVGKSEVRRNSLRSAFTSLTLYARMNKIDFLLISGDLFDCDYVSRDTTALILKEFAALGDCKIIISPGNHDPYTSSSFYRRADFSDNVYIFDSEEVGYFDFPEKNTTVYGYAFKSNTLDHCPIVDVSPQDPERINILMAHGELGKSESKNCPLPLETLREGGFDYVALGHYHEHGGMKTVGNTYYAYSGCLEGRGFDELGIKGAIACVADKHGERLDFGSKLVRFSKRVYEIERVDVNGSQTNSDLETHISELIAEHHFGEETALRVILVGEVDSSLRPATDYLATRFASLASIEIIDRTTPTLDSASLKRDPTVRGEFYSALEELLGSDDADERQIASDALRLGLAALAGEEIGG